MKPATFYADIILADGPFIERLTGAKMTPEANCLLMAIAGQESGWRERRQLHGPARSYWQFEKLGGVAEVFQKCTKQITPVCVALDILATLDVVFEAMAWNDTLALAMARLLLWQDAAPLPALGQEQAAWDYYNRNWRPGAPHPDAWSANYKTALDLARVRGT